MLSATAAYAIRAALYLGMHEGEGPVRVDDVADALEVPKNYLSKVLHTLVKEGVLQSSRGPNGGFELAAPSSALTLFEVVRPFDDIEARRQCLLGQGECSDEDPCALHGRWSGVAADMAAFFRETSLGEVLGDMEKQGRVNTEVGP